MTYVFTWAPAGMGKGGGTSIFCALVVTVKRSVDKKFMNYFHSLSVASEGFAPDLHRAPSLDPAGKLSSQDP